MTTREFKRTTIDPNSIDSNAYTVTTEALRDGDDTGAIDVARASAISVQVSGTPGATFRMSVEVRNTVDGEWSARKLDLGFIVLTPYVVPCRQLRLAVTGDADTNVTATLLIRT
ncbi:hypothetical protein BH10PSE17_BH10PSE17_25120 [soil metagenome]